MAFYQRTMTIVIAIACAINNNNYLSCIWDIDRVECRRCKQFCLLKFESVLTNVTQNVRAQQFTLKNCSRHICRQPYAKCATSVSIKCCCALQLFYFACVCVSVLWMFISLRFFLLLLIPLKHYNIILTHSKHIKRNACWVNKFFSSSFSASSNDTNIERTHSKLYSCHSILHSEQLIFEKEKNTIHSILVGMCACVCVVRIQSHPGQTYIFVCFLLKNGVKFNSYPE